MFDPNTIDTESDWLPPPQPDAWRKWKGRVVQVAVLHAIFIGIPAAVALTGLIPPRSVARFMFCGAPALVLVWVGLIAYAITRSKEHEGTPAERGRMLVLMFDVFTGIFTVLGLASWLGVIGAF
jgi:hypothetical protein